MRRSIVDPKDWDRYGPCRDCGVAKGPCLRLDRFRRPTLGEYVNRPHAGRFVRLRVNVLRRSNVCKLCQRTREELRRHFGDPHDRGLIRGMCATCYRRTLERGHIDIHPRITRPGVDVVEDYVFLREQGEINSYREAADRLGVSYEALLKAIGRHRPELLQRRRTAA